MNKRLLAIPILALGVIIAVPAWSQTGSMTVATKDSVVWKGDPHGMQIAKIAGDPLATGVEFTIWLRMPASFVMRPHWHPVDENLIVLSGTFLLGTGEKADRSRTSELKAGTFAQIPKTVPHFGFAQEDTVIQVHGIGPFITNWIPEK